MKMALKVKVTFIIIRSNTVGDGTPLLHKTSHHKGIPMDTPRSFSLLRSLATLVGLTASLLPTTALANERHFTLSYETATLPAGAVEIEPQTTFRMGKDQYYLGIDHRLEFEFGITDRLMSALYLNFGSETARNGSNLDAVFASRGVSSEWKYKLSDSVADALGLALYLELTAAPTEYEVEAKLLMDKRVGQMHLVGNVIYEAGFEHKGYWNTEHKIGASLGASYFLSDHLTVGLEAWAEGIVEAEEDNGDKALQHGALFVGPVVGYASRGWWIAASATPQVVGFGKTVSESAGFRDLDDYHAMQARVLLGIHL